VLFLLELVPALLLGVLLARSWPELAGVLAPPLAPLVLQTAAPTAVSVLLLSEAAEGGAGGAGGPGALEHPGSLAHGAALGPAAGTDRPQPGWGNRLTTRPGGEHQNGAGFSARLRASAWTSW
jgi:hypothetical protein